MSELNRPRSIFYRAVNGFRMGWRNADLDSIAKLRSISMPGWRWSYFWARTGQEAHHVWWALTMHK